MYICTAELAIWGVGRDIIFDKMNVYTHRTAAFVLAWRSKLDIIRILWRASPSHMGTPEIMRSTRLNPIHPIETA